MRLKAVALCAMMIVAVVGVSHAAGECWFGPTGGVSVPMSDFGDAAKLGFNAGGVLTYSVNDQFGLGLDAGYHMWNGSDDLNDALSAVLSFFNGSPVVAEAKWSAIQLSAHGQYNIPTEGKVNPYLRAGVGLYNAKLKLDTDVLGSDETSKSKVGFNVGGGANIMTSDKMAVGINGAYHVISAKDDFGADLNMVTVNVSLLWKAGGK